INRHLRELPRYCREGRLFRACQLVALKEYPHGPSLGAFYAQSVSLVEFLAGAKGPQTFARFVRDSLRDGYEEALTRHYGWDFEELERRWQQHAFGDGGAPAGAPPNDD